MFGNGPGGLKTQLTCQSLLGIPKTRVLFPGLPKPSRMVHACARDVETGKAEVHAHSQLKASLGDMGPCENKKRK